MSQDFQPSADNTRLDLSPILHCPEGKVKTSFTLDLSNLDFFGEKPIQNPVTIDATVENHGGALVLQGQASSLLQLCCDRCGESISTTKNVPLDSLVAQTLEDQEHDEILLLEGTYLPLGEIATTAFILAMDTKTLCSDQCKGLCPRCGVNLNQKDCTCPQENTSPFVALASLLIEDD